MQTRIRLIALSGLVFCVLVISMSARRLIAETDFQSLLPESPLSKLTRPIDSMQRLNQFAAVVQNNPLQTRYTLAFAEYLEQLAVDAKNKQARDAYYRRAYLAYESILKVRPASGRALLSLSIFSAYGPELRGGDTVFFERALKQAYWDSSLSTRLIAAGFANWPAMTYRQQRAFAFWLGKGLEENRISITVAKRLAERYGRSQELSVIAQNFAG